MTDSLLLAEKQHLSHLLEAIQRCVYFLDAAARKIPWPLTGDILLKDKKDTALFEALSAFNERFSKLQDTLGAAMRHALLLLAEPADSFLKVLAYYEKHQVLKNIAAWQLLRTSRNIAAHDYEIDYTIIAEHFNTLHEMVDILYQTARRFTAHCAERLQIVPASADFSREFMKITQLEEPVNLTLGKGIGPC